jgi:hypothetical protein
LGAVIRERRIQLTKPLPQRFVLQSQRVEGLCV